MASDTRTGRLDHERRATKTSPLILCATLALAVTLLPGPASPLRAQESQPAAVPATASSPPIHAAKITILSTMMTDRLGFAEWGFSALVEAGGRRVLFDTGGRPDTVLRNARELGVDLSDIEDVILSQ